MATVSYPYDSSGTNPANLVTNEMQVMSQINGDPYRYLIPDFAPFYQTNFSAKAKNALGATIILQYGVDYVFSMRYIGATRANGAAIFGAISIINQVIQGPLTLTYQCLGGQYSANRNYVIQTIAQNNYNPRRIAWDQVTDAPAVFPPSGHPEDLDTFTGFRDLIDAIDRITAANGNTDTLRNELRQHTLNVSDPHETLNILPASIVHRPELEAHTKNYNDPHRTIALLPTDYVRKPDMDDAILPLATKAELTAHTSSRNDPHQTLALLPTDLIQRPEMIEAIASVNNQYVTAPLTRKQDVIYVSSPHPQVMTWDAAVGSYERAAWHRPGLLHYSYTNPASIPGHLLVSPNITHNQASYPELTKVLGLSGIGTFNLVDVRGQFLRVLDNGRGVDINRANMSSQDQALQSHNHYLPTSTSDLGSGWALIDTGNGDTSWTQSSVNSGPAAGQPAATTFPNPLFPGSGLEVYNPLVVGNVGTFALETRPTNVAFSLWISF